MAAFSPDSSAMETSVAIDLWSNSIVKAWWRANGNIPVSRLSFVVNFRWTDGLTASMPGKPPVRVFYAIL